MARCRKCGSELHLGDKECSFCFTPLSPIEIAELEREHNRDSYIQKNAIKFKKEKNRKKLFIILPIVIVVIAALGAAGYIFRTPIINTFNKVAGHVSAKEETEKDRINKIKALAQEAYTDCQNYDISMTQYNTMDEYVTAVTKEKVQNLYPELANDVITIRVTGDKITYVGHNDNYWTLNKAYEIWSIEDK